MFLEGERWYVVAEILFIISCMTQCASGLVVTAHSIDGILARFVEKKLIIKNVYKLSLFPASYSEEHTDCK